MAKFIDVPTIVPAAPGSYALIFSFMDFLDGPDEIVESQPVIVAWKIDDEAIFQKVIPVFAGREAPAIFHPAQVNQRPMELVFLPDHDNRLRLYNGDTVVNNVEEARAYAKEVGDELSAQPRFTPDNFGSEVDGCQAAF